MSGKINNGGPAFPTVSSSVHLPHHGMTLRDWFAGMALQAMIQRDSAIAVHELSEHEQENHPPIFYNDPAAYDQVTIECYHVADAMLDAREGKEDA